MNEYRALKCNNYSDGDYTLRPISFEDRVDILKWRNEQIYHLRQSKILTLEEQDLYFENHVMPLFSQESPSQILFSFFYKGDFVAYGGLVHINWLNKNAEISFLIDTNLASTHFYNFWAKFLDFISEVSFGDLKFNKIFTTSYEIRQNLYAVLEDKGFVQEGCLKRHYYHDHQYFNMLFHSKFNDHLFIRNADLKDDLILYTLFNDVEVRKWSFSSENITFEDHQKWLFSTLHSNENFLFIIENHLKYPVGQVRFTKIDESNWSVGISIDKKFRGNGYSVKIISLGIEALNKRTGSRKNIHAFIKGENKASIRCFEKSGFKLVGERLISDYKQLQYSYENR